MERDLANVLSVFSDLELCCSWHQGPELRQPAPSGMHVKPSLYTMAILLAHRESPHRITNDAIIRIIRSWT
ncbi:hypothetical protein LX36DRAFT_655293 [Colletotrichum falcatum]|nr:hypothetical protein LX36DRAFT_655293 [Colletotrichum falcatum]